MYIVMYMYLHDIVLLTLSAHEQKGYNTCFVYVCLTRPRGGIVYFYDLNYDMNSFSFLFSSFTILLILCIFWRSYRKYFNLIVDLLFQSISIFARDLDYL